MMSAALVSDFESYEPAAKKRRTGLINSSQSTSSPSLYKDAVHSIIGFLSFKELIAVTQLNNFWRECVRSLKPVIPGTVRLHMHCMMQQNYPVDNRCALLPHVATVVSFPINNSVKNDSKTLAFATLSLFPSLQSIKWMDPIKLGKEHLLQLSALPSSLTSLQMPISEYALQDWINEISKLKQLKSLRLCYLGKMLDAVASDFNSLSEQTSTARIDFRPLLQLTQLEDFEFTHDPIDEDDEEQEWQDNQPDYEVTPFFGRLLDVIREFRSLKRLTLHSLDYAVMERLSREPCNLLQLQRINSSIEIRAGYSEDYNSYLTKFPSLTEFQPTFDQFECSNASFLRSFKNLVMLVLPCYDDVQIPDAQNLIQSMSDLKQLRKFRFAHPQFNGDHLQKLLPQLPQLQELELHLAKLDHLDALQADSIKSTLVSLKLFKCLALKSRELMKLRSLSRLTTLCLSDDFKLCDMATWQFDPSSYDCIIPTLTTFTYPYVYVRNDGFGFRSRYDP